MHKQEQMAWLQGDWVIGKETQIRFIDKTRGLTTLLHYTDGRGIRMPLSDKERNAVDETDIIIARLMAV